MHNVMLVFVVLFIISIIIELALNYYKEKVQNDLVLLIANREHDKFDKRIKEKKMCFLIPIANYHMLKINNAIVQNKLNEVIFEVHELEKLKLNDEQNTFVYCKAFAYFLSVKDNKNVEKYYSVVKNLPDSASKKYAEMVYDTLVKNNYSYIKDAEKILDNAEGEDKFNILTLLFQMYTNKNDEKMTKKYLEMIEAEK